MVLTEEEKRERQREANRKYKAKNKEKIKEKRKEYYEENKEKVLEHKKEYYDENKEKRKEYLKTPAGMKSIAISSWKKYGVKGDLEKLYEIKQNTTNCNHCNKEFAYSYDKCLDHDHDTGEFRQILCRACNGFDNWNKN